MRKIYVLDTSVLVYDPFSFKSFSGNDVVIPISVLDELDKLKNLPNETGKNARVCIRALDAICNEGEIDQGINIDNDILLKIDTTNNPNIFGTDSYIDNKILACAYAISTKDDQRKTVLVSQDINLRIRAKAFKIKSEDYKKDKLPVQDMYAGYQVIESDEIGDLLYEKEQIDDYRKYDELHSLLPNECVHFVSPTGDGLSIGRRVGDKVKIISDKTPWGLDLRNKEQAFAVDLLADPRISLVTLIGKAGTGKTLAAVAAGLEMVLEKKLFNKLIIYRPIQPVGNDIGYLPGTMEEKLAPWMSAISDSFEFLFEAKSGNKWKTMFDMYVEKGKIQMEAITYVRGRSIPNAFIIVDEAQNLSKEEVKTILTRASSGTKIVLTGDIEQIDNSILDATNNGLSYVVEKFKDSDLAGHITFTKGERSALASKAAEIL
ncbi:MAG TPA: PhoH family protein [Anaerovoracaceae bacterium]|nr:PhoH family protein [Anaerovoracaceae bacterium]